MIRYFVVAVVLVGIVAGIGYALRDRLFGSSAPAPVSAPPVTVVVVADAAVIERTIVIDVEGRVEKRSGATWLPVASGDELSAQDTIRTSDGAHAHLKTGEELVELGDRSEVTVGEISATVSRYLLSEGRVTANAGPARGHTIRIETRGTDAVAEAETGKFDVSSSGNGHVAVASEQGDVKVTAHGKSVDVHAGEQTLVTAGAEPSTPTKIPPSLFLKVSAAGGNRDTTAALHGETAPGAIVSVNGVRSMADDKGSFDSKVALVTGDNVIVVSVEDATGRSKRQVIKRNLDRSGPKVNTEVDWK